MQNVLGELYFPAKAKSFQTFLTSSIIFKNFLFFVKSMIWGKSIFGGLDELMTSKCDEEKFSFSNKVVKDSFVFPLFLSKLMFFKFKCGDYRFDFRFMNFLVITK